MIATAVCKSRLIACRILDRCRRAQGQTSVMSMLDRCGRVCRFSVTEVVKKLSGEGAGSAEWFTSTGNEHSQIVSFVLTCEESAEKLQPMCCGVMNRFQLANQPVPKILYVDSGCCRAQGLTAVETLFQPWVDNGMVVRLDIFHWIHRFDAAICTGSHSKCAMFKSALAGAVLAEQLKHHVRRVTLRAQETFQLVHLAIEKLQGPTGLDENGASLFRTPEAIDEMWAAQQRHLECIQDPPDMNMYRVAHTNNVDVPYYKRLRGNSLEGFHKTLPNMIPGT
ncbi:hypothetical protein AOLI_G00108010 [Acnodon oligacanthus]